MPSISHRVETPNERHNLDAAYRKKLPNVVPELVKYNEVLKKKNVSEIYDEHLQKAFDDFNARQKRRDRRLDVKYDCSTYLEYQRILDKRAQQSDNKIAQKGRPPIREIVLQFGNPEQGYGCLNQTDENRNRIKAMLKDVDAELEKKYPQFVWGDSVIHCDEHSVEFCEEENREKEYGSIHLHKDFVPLCFDNKQGPDIQVAFERCLEEMGFPSFETWKLDVDRLMESVLQKYELERTYMDNHEKHKDSKEFHRQQQVVRQTKELEQQKVAAEKALSEKEEQLEQAKVQLHQQQGQIRLNQQKLQKQKETYEHNQGVVQKQQQQYQQNQIKLEKQKENLSATVEMLLETTGSLERQQELLDAADEMLEEKLGGFDDGLKKAAERAEKNNRYKLFEKFINLPIVKPLWEKFIESEKEHNRNKGIPL